VRKAFAYYRKSIEREADKSIKGQQEEVHAFAKKNDIEIVAEFAEVASSATLERKEFQAMLQELKKWNDIDFIIVHRFDRISREVHHMGYILSVLENTKTKLISVTEDNDYDNDPTKLMMIMMKTYGSTIERIAIVDRLQSARRRKKEKGGFIGGTPPMGYRSVHGTGKLAIESTEVPIVLKTFELRKKGFSMQKIADKLNELGYKTRKNRSFHAATIQRILKHRDLYEGKGEAEPILNVQGKK
jgi:site-specific DNA recombinase